MGDQPIIVFVKTWQILEVLLVYSYNIRPVLRVRSTNVLQFLAEGHAASIYTGRSTGALLCWCNSNTAARYVAKLVTNHNKHDIAGVHFVARSFYNRTYLLWYLV